MIKISNVMFSVWNALVILINVVNVFKANLEKILIKTVNVWWGIMIMIVKLLTVSHVRKIVCIAKMPTVV